MRDFTRRLLTEWRRLNLPFSQETFVVAVSGGADSVSLLLALNELRTLKKLNLRFVVAHFNHNLRGEESEMDEQFVKSLAGEFGFELALGAEKIPSVGNLEQSARNARYKFLTELAENLKACGVLTAHTQNDQAETFLINLIRGSGLEGLGGMKPIRNFKFQVSDFKLKDEDLKPETFNLKPFLIRPLLSWAKRIDTENFCHLNGVEYRYDSMNEDLTFKRVRVRKVLLPLLEDFNPKIVEILAQTAALLREDFEELQAASVEKVKRNASDRENNERQTTLTLKEIRDIFPSMRRRILRDWLKNCRGNLRSLEAKHFEAIENLIFSRKSGRQIELPEGEIVVKEKGKLHFKVNSN
jgi:tRNA(Ile)-lysidine synthase